MTPCHQSPCTTWAMWKSLNQTLSVSARQSSCPVHQHAMFKVMPHRVQQHDMYRPWHMASELVFIRYNCLIQKRWATNTIQPFQLNPLALPLQQKHPRAIASSLHTLALWNWRQQRQSISEGVLINIANLDENAIYWELWTNSFIHFVCLSLSCLDNYFGFGVLWFPHDPHHLSSCLAPVEPSLRMSLHRSTTTQKITPNFIFARVLSWFWCVIKRYIHYTGEI